MTIFSSAFAPTQASDGRSNTARVIGLLLVVGITAGIILGWGEIERLGVYGYPAVFLISLLGNATVVFPAPSFALVAVAGGALDPIGVGVVAGLGAALGEMTGYLAGYSGQTIFQERPLYRRIEYWMKKSGTMAIFILSAVPNPAFDVAGIIAGAMRMPAWRFLLAAWFGKSLRFGLLAALGALAW